MNTGKATIEAGKAVLGLELGSTRIKATLIAPDGEPLASGSYGWENTLKDGIWTYGIDEVWTGIQGSMSDLMSNVESSYSTKLTKIAAAGFSGMMHGYVALDETDQLLVPFRTWRNNRQEQAAEELMELLDFPIAQRWSIAHLYQAILNGESHLAKLAHITTIAGYVHATLTGRKVIGIGEASGMFPVDPDTQAYDADMIARFDNHIAGRGLPWKIGDLLPGIVAAGEPAGSVDAETILKLDPTGTLQPGFALCPPEGDAGTGMIATNSIRRRTGNVSAGTSAFAMLVLERKLSRVHPEIDLVLTPDGNLVAMAHSNNCTSDLDAWVALLGQAGEALGAEVNPDKLYGTLLPLALEGDPDCGGMLAYGYVSGEHVTGFSDGRPMFVRSPSSGFTIQNFMRTHLFTALGALRTGLDILTGEEGVQVEEIRGHGGFFKTPEVGQRMMAAATRTPISLMETAGEGGAWGMALLAAYMVREDESQTLADFLEVVFADSPSSLVTPTQTDVDGFDVFFKRYTKGLVIERAAVDAL